MRHLLLFFLLFFSFSALSQRQGDFSMGFLIPGNGSGGGLGGPTYTQHYYFDQNGLDANDGKTPATAWATISKFNSVTKHAKDSFLFNAAQQWTGQLVPNHDSIYIGSYNGALATFTGGDTLTSWTNVSGSIYKTSLASRPHMVRYDSLLQDMGRSPNKWVATNGGYLLDEGHGDNGTNAYIINSTLHTYSDLTGAILLYRHNHFETYQVPVIRHSGDTIFIFEGADLTLGRGFWLQGQQQFLTTPGDWYYNTTTHELFVNGNPAGHTIIAAQRNNLLAINNLRNVTVRGINFMHTNDDAISLTNSVNTTLDSVNGYWLGHNYLTTYNSDTASITNFTVYKTNNSGIVNDPGPHYTDAQPLSTHFTIEHFKIDSTGCYAGMWDWEAYDPSGIGILQGYGDDANSWTIRYGTIKNAGYLGVRLSGNNILIEYNDFGNCNIAKDDGGQVYLWHNYSGSAWTNIVIRQNIFDTAKGSVWSLNGIIQYGLGTQTSNLYFDDGWRSNVKVDTNFMQHGDLSNVYFHNTTNVYCKGNIFAEPLDNNVVITKDGLSSFYAGHDTIVNCVFTHAPTMDVDHCFINITDSYTDSSTLIANVGVFTANYFNSYPGTSHKILAFSPSGSPVVHSFYTKSEWETAWGITLTGTTEGPTELYSESGSRSDYMWIQTNKTSTSQTYELPSGSWKNANTSDATTYSGSITLAHHTGVVLIKVT